MALHYSPDLVSILKKINCEISNKILDFNGGSNQIACRLNFLDITNERLGYISFANIDHTLCKFDKEIVEKIFYDKDSSIHNDLWKISRNYLKVGKLVSKLGLNFTPSEIEDFTNKFKSEVLNIKPTNIQIVSGKDIAKWYNQVNYATDDIGDLGKSCMRYNRCKEYFDIYTDNEDACKLVIITNNDNKLIARALLWKVSKIKIKIEEKTKKRIKFDYVLDRTYSLNSYDNYTLYEYARKNNWGIIKSRKLIEYDEETYYLSLEVKIKSKEYNKYPFLDTFSRFNYKKGLLYNDDNECEIGHILKDLYGSYQKSISKFKYFKNSIMLWW